MFSKISSIVLLAIGVSGSAFAQDDLEAMLEKTQSSGKEIVTGTFKGTHVVNLQSVEKVAPGALQYMIQHRFGPVNGGAYEFYGLDQSTIRMALEYGLHRFLSVGLGRSSMNKAFDLYAKASIVQQSKGKGSFPLSIVYFGSIMANTTHWQDPTRENYFSSRLAYTHQLIIASKITPDLSLEVVPTFIHKNLVKYETDPNDFFAVGFGGRYRFTKRMSFNAEYIYRIPPSDRATPAYANYFDSFSLGIDIETGGHVFQIMLTNSLPIYEVGFVTETSEQWSDGGIHLGFNISRDFVLKKKKAPQSSPVKKK